MSAVCRALQRKKKGKKSISTEALVNVNNCTAVENNDEESRSPMLFCYDSQVKKKRKSTKKHKPVKVKKKLHEKQTQHESDTSIVSENQGDAEDFIIEETKGHILSRKVIHLQAKSDQPELNNHSIQDYCSRSTGRTDIDLLDDVPSVHDHPGECSSVEIPRDAMQSSTLCLGSLINSPSVHLEESDEDSIIDSGRSKKFPLMNISSPRLAGSISSCRSKTTDFCSSRTGSDYTYSYVSTYTDATATVSAKTITASPPVKMKVCPNLNSTVCRGKDCIGDVEFPQSISPVVKHKVHLLPQAKCLQQECTFRSDDVRSLKTKDKVKQRMPKSSTVLFGSENTSSLHLVSDNLTTIHSGDMGKSGETYNIPDRIPSRKHSTPLIPATNEDNVASRQHELKEFQKSKRRCLVSASTPRGSAKKLLLDISPIKHTTLDDDELHIHDSTIVNSEEIIVPSLKEPASQDRFDTVHKNNTSAAPGQSTQMFINNQSGHHGDTCLPHSYRQHSSGTDNKVMLEKSVLQTGTTFSRSTCRVKAVETSGKHCVRSQVEMIPYSKDIKIPETSSDTRNKTHSSSFHGDLNVTDVHTEQCGFADKHSLLTEQYSKSHYQVTIMPSTHGMQAVQQENRMPCESHGTFSQEFLYPHATKKQYKKRSLKSFKQSVSTLCYINRLCMASQKYLRAALRTVHQ
ncbi:hypothetical protein BsWGS_11028 [Bradybaena similaris]